MSNLTIHSEPPTRALVKPEPRGGPITIRVASVHDLRFMDDLQKKHSKMVGFLPEKVFRTRIAEGNVLIAEQAGDPNVCPIERIGYIMFLDKYLKREELGIVYQLNVVPGKQRGLVGASLVKAAFERSAYGCKLFCCWCAQDIEANHFWESIGFVPIAFRAGARGREQGGRRKEGRMQIFWQRRIREGDVGEGATPYWYPSETSGGAMKENRLVLPIHPGTHWSDAKPMVLPGNSKAEGVAVAALPESDAAKPKRTPKPKPKAPANPVAATGGLWFAAPTPPPPTEVAEPKPKRVKQPPRKNDPKLVAAAREFRDRYLDEVNAGAGNVLPSSQGKYDVSRQFVAAQPTESVPLLNAA